MARFAWSEISRHVSFIRCHFSRAELELCTGTRFACVFLNALHPGGLQLRVRISAVKHWCVELRGLWESEKCCELECVQQYWYFGHFCLFINWREDRKLVASQIQTPIFYMNTTAECWQHVFFLFFWVFLSLVERKQEIMTRNRKNCLRNKGQIQNCISCILSTIVAFFCLLLLSF